MQWMLLLLVCTGLILSEFLCADDIDIYLDSNTARPVLFKAYGHTEGSSDLYMAMFEPGKTERWAGNIKKLKLVDVKKNGVREILDVVNAGFAEQGLPYVSAINNKTGLIEIDALTFWTKPDFLVADDNIFAVENRDGDSVRRGGAGQVVPQFLSGIIDNNNAAYSRQIYTENGHGGLMAFNADAENLQELFPLFDLDRNGRPSSSELLTIAGIDDLVDVSDKRQAIVKLLMHYARGVDISAEDYNYTRPEGSARDWILGDVIHSRPLVLNYGNISGNPAIQNPYISIVVGSNDGMLHIFQNTDVDGKESGIERYAFLPRELFPILPVLALNDGRYDNPHGKSHHPYGMDGEISAMVFDDSLAVANNNQVIDANLPGVNDFAYIYAAMRRGGRSYYAFDVTNPFRPPVFVGRISKNDNSGNFAELGLSFSKPIPALVKFDENVTPVLVFSGGYDVGKDDYKNTNAKGELADPDNKGRSDDTGYFDNTHGREPDSEGNAIYVVNALTLELIWKASNNKNNGISNSHFYHAGLDTAIPSTVQVVDANDDGYMDRLYVGDMAGNVWRADFPECSATSSCSNPDHRQEYWRVSLLASFGHASAKGDNRFFHPPAVVSTRDASGDYDAVIIASGDRENPREITDQNRIYMIKDRVTVSGGKLHDVYTLADLAEVTPCIKGDEYGCAAKLNSQSLVNGWRINLAGETDGGCLLKGEKVLSQAAVVAGKIMLTTYVPYVDVASRCVPAEGFSNFYALDLKDGTATAKNLSRHVRLAAGLAGDALVDGQTVILPGIVPVDFLLSDEQKKQWWPDKKIPDQGYGLSVIPAGVAGSKYLYWRENNIGDTQ